MTYDSWSINSFATILISALRVQQSERHLLSNYLSLCCPLNKYSFCVVSSRTQPLRIPSSSSSSIICCIAAHTLHMKLVWVGLTAASSDVCSARQSSTSLDSHHRRGELVNIQLQLEILGDRIIQHQTQHIKAFRGGSSLSKPGK